MIEFKFNQTPGEPDWTWVPINTACLLENVNFERSSIRIDGVVYTEQTEDLEEKFNKAITWMRLQE